MNFITADTATFDSVETALDDAFNAAGLDLAGNWQKDQINDQIKENLEAYALYCGVEADLITQGRSQKLTRLRTKFITDQFELGYSGGEIERATGMSRNVVYGALGRAKK